MASALQPSEVSICVLASMYLPWHCSYPYGWCEQKGQAQTETELCLISRSDHFILGLKYTSRAQRGISTLQKCFVSRDVKAVLLTRINIQPTSGEFAGHCLGEGSQVLAGSSQRPHALVRDTCCPVPLNHTWYRDLSGSSLTRLFFCLLRALWSRQIRLASTP